MLRLSSSAPFPGHKVEPLSKNCDCQLLTFFPGYIDLRKFIIRILLFPDIWKILVPVIMWRTYRTLSDLTHLSNRQLLPFSAFPPTFTVTRSFPRCNQGNFQSRSSYFLCRSASTSFAHSFYSTPKYIVLESERNCLLQTAINWVVTVFSCVSLAMAPEVLVVNVIYFTSQWNLE
jgi:hypothetical protein